MMVGCGFFGGLFMKERGYMVSKQQDDMKAMQMLHLRIEDIQEIILQELKRRQGGFTQDEFSEAIRSAVGQQLTQAELNLLFRVYNKNEDGILSTTDVLRFLCDHQGLFFCSFARSCRCCFSVLALRCLRDVCVAVCCVCSGHHQKPGSLADMTRFSHNESNA